MSTRPVDLSIIIPAYMEAAVISGTLIKLAHQLDSRDYGQVEVLVVVADSPDGTAELVRAEAHRFRSLMVLEPGPRVGKGRDVRYGMQHANGRYRLFMDADLATPLVHLDQVAAQIAHGAEVIIATRNLWSIHHGLLRKLISTLGNVATQILILPGIRDSQCGFKVFRADIAHVVFGRQTMTGWSFDGEVLAIARKHGYHIKTIPVPDWTDPKDGNMGLVGDSPLAAALKTFRDLFIIRLNLWRGRYR